MKIVAVRGDITQVDVDAVVNPAEARSREAGEQNDQLVERAGLEVETEAKARGPIQVGEAMLTTGGQLRCKYVIHAPAGQGAEAPDPEGVKRSTLAALRCAAEGRLRSVAIPAFALGTGATQALISALRDFDAEGGLEEVFIVGENGEIVSAIKKEIGSGN
jgi:O-acetyl-ADP-ribose deacetylase (regulator of RNase III)